MLEDLAVGEVQRRAVHEQAQAEPVGRRHRLADTRLGGAVAVHAGHEGGRRRGRRALLERAARAGLAVGHGHPGLDLALAEGVEAVHPEEPRRIGRRLGEALAGDALAQLDLRVEDAQEPLRAAAEVQHRRRHAAALGTDRDVLRADRAPAPAGGRPRPARRRGSRTRRRRPGGRRPRARARGAGSAPPSGCCRRRR